MVVSGLRREQFLVPVAGTLFQSHLDHQVSIRVTKNATKVDVPCQLVVRWCHAQFSLKLSLFLRASTIRGMKMGVPVATN